MSRSSRASTLLIAVSAVFVAAGVAVHAAFESPVRLLPALVLTSGGLFGVTSVAARYPVERLGFALRRAWLVTVVAMLPYGLATSPASEQAAAAGRLFSGPVAGTASEALAGAAVLCAVAVTVVYGIARYGVHPGRPTPEERVLTDEWND